MANFVNGKDCLINLDLVQQVKFDDVNKRITFMIADRSELEEYSTTELYDDAVSQINTLLITV